MSAGSLLIVLGGPAMLIGLGGGAASSVGSGTAVRRNSTSLRSSAAIRKSSVARNRSSTPAGPLVSTTRKAIRSQIIHDVGAGGCPTRCRSWSITASAAPRWNCGTSPVPKPACRRWRSGATRRRSATCWPSMPQRLEWFDAVCRRERCPYAVIGVLDDSGELIVRDRRAGDRPVDMPLEVLLGKPPRTRKDIRRSRVRARRCRVPLRSPGSLPARAAHADGGRQVVFDSHRRPHGRRPGGARPAGRPLAGARSATSR